MLLSCKLHNTFEGAQTADLWLRSACSRAVAISLSIVSCCAAFSAAMRSSCVCFW